MAFCVNCGQQLGEGAKFCTNCGQTVTTHKTESSERKTVYDGEIHKCPNCGEHLEFDIECDDDDCDCGCGCHCDDEE